MFGMSAIDGPTRFFDDMIGTLVEGETTIRFEFEKWIKMSFPLASKPTFRAVMSDFIHADVDGKPLFVTFADADTLVGYSPVVPTFSGEEECIASQTHGVDMIKCGRHYMAMLCKPCATGYQFSICHSTIMEVARSGALDGLDADIKALQASRYAYYEGMPAPKMAQYEELYYKALSINKVNVQSAEGKIPCRWTTPDRVPHRSMWLWDSVFHALAINTYNPALAEEAIWAVLTCARKDGFIAHMMNPMGRSDVTQPPVLSWGVWSLYQSSGNKAYLAKCVNALDAYLVWDYNNRKGESGLLQWLTDPEDVLCKCGESGLDDSPRFDKETHLDAIDFSTFFAQDCDYLSRIYAELGNTLKATYWARMSADMKTRINTLLWDDKDGMYYDRMLNGELTGMLTTASFLPLFAGIPSKERAAQMIRTLTDPNKLWSINPLCSITQEDPSFSNAMWRGGVWLNHNYFVIAGLRRYGYNQLADTLREKTLAMVNKWYLKTGSIFEFYDPLDEVAPYLCQRKGECTYPPDWRKHMHAIADYNWSASFTILLINA